jgi:hypothetical protein
VRHASRFSNFLRMEVSMARVSQSGLRSVEAQRWVVHVAPLRRLHRRQVEDGQVNATGYVGPCYPTFVIFNMLGPRVIVVI